MPKILVVCRSNESRSVILAAMLAKELGAAYEVTSAGYQRDKSGRPTFRFAVQSMSEKGFDISNHRSRWIGGLNLWEYSHIVCVDATTRREVAQRLHGAKSIVITVKITNPPARDLANYRALVDCIELVAPGIAEMIRNKKPD